ncbi:hypothetical protein [Ferrimonas balearica]|uniref:hypothetical protein n=1 Tax=Ferrimonas balearica TaxID=44012 RepID=UPI001C99F33D|nr:hypothetical protein [Ferrimonas balearica]MBY5992865.1 hypothetical protein [Ferrimonas balearica]
MRKHPISARLDDADYDLLMAIDWNGATTQSDKLRELIAFARECAFGQHTPEQAQPQIDRLLAPLRQRLPQADAPLAKHYLTHLPDLLRPGLTPPPPCATSAEQQAWERQILDASLQWLDTLLRQHLGKAAPAGAPDPLAGLARLYLEIQKETDHE